MPLGSLYGPQEPLLGSLWTTKTLKNQLFFKVFANAGFWVFQALGGPLGWLRNRRPPSLRQNLPQPSSKSFFKLHLNILRWRPSSFLGPAECAERLNKIGRPAPPLPKSWENHLNIMKIQYILMKNQ